MEVNGKRWPIKAVHLKPEFRFDSWPHTIFMKTPALKSFLNAVGKVVHHLNTVVVGLSGVESGTCKKPSTLDISWTPSDLTSSSRSARAYTLKSSIVFLAAEISSYVHATLKSPPCKTISLPKDADKAKKLERVVNHFNITSPDLALGPLLLLHWRNRIIHHNSNAQLTKSERSQFVAASSEIMAKYKNLDPTQTLEHFTKGTPTLKDVSSLLAMSINCAKAIDSALPEPTSMDELLTWIAAMGLEQKFDRAKRVAENSANSEKSMRNFFTTHCPCLVEYYVLYNASDPEQ